jgi:hypothetical protein
MVSFSTTQPNTLLAAIKTAIQQGKVTTWSLNTNGDLTHTPEQWKWKAYLRPVATAGAELRFAIIRPSNANISTEVYAVYHGRFVEMMLAHFDKMFTNAASTAMPTTVDNVQAA